MQTSAPNKTVQSVPVKYWHKGKIAGARTLSVGLKEKPTAALDKVKICDKHQFLHVLRLSVGPVTVDRELPQFFGAVLKLCAILKLVRQDGNGVATMVDGREEWLTKAKAVFE